MGGIRKLIKEKINWSGEIPRDERADKTKIKG